MKKDAKAVLRTGCALLITVLGAAYQPALADCSQSIFFGNYNFLTYLDLDIADPSAFWKTYFFQDPSINQGAVDVRSVSFDTTEFFGPRTAVIQSDWAAGLGLQGCPCRLGDLFCFLDDAINEVFVFGDSRGVTIIVTASTRNVFDFDTTKLSGGVLNVTNFKPRVVSTSAVSEGVLVTLDWDDPVVNTDERSVAIAGQIIGSYRLIEERRHEDGSVSEGEVADLDGNTRDSRATVRLVLEARASSTVRVVPSLNGSAGPFGEFRGGTSAVILLEPSASLPCDPLSLFGNLGDLTTVPLDLSDPAMFWQTYIFQEPSISLSSTSLFGAPVYLNTVTPGQVDVHGYYSIVLESCGPGPIKDPYGEICILTPCALDANGNGLIDDEGVKAVFVFGDSHGVTLIVEGSVQNSFDFDRTNPSGGPLRVTNFNPRLLGTPVNSGDLATFDIGWEAPYINTDGTSGEAASQVLGAYRIFERRVRDGTLVSSSEVPDLDGNPLDNRARVQLMREEGVTSELQLVPGLNGASGPYSSFVGGKVTVLLTPGLATPGPGKGKGKGLEKAPGQNR